MANPLRQLWESLTGQPALQQEQQRAHRASMQADIYREQYDDVRERLADLELAAEDLGWQSLSGEIDREFSRNGRATYQKFARTAYLKSALINRAVNIQALYVCGQGYTVTCEDDAIDLQVQEFLAHPKNQVELFSHQALTLKETSLQVFGDLFFVFFFEASTGSTFIRSIPPEDIVDVICNPDDAKEPWYYKRVWSVDVLDFATGTVTKQRRTAYYPDVDFQGVRPAKIGPDEVVESPVLHVKVGALDDMRFGLPEIYQALDWARAHKKQLEDWATVVQALSRFAWKQKTSGGAAAVKAIKTRLASTFGMEGAARVDSNPAPATASTAIMASGEDLEPIKTAGAGPNPGDSRLLLLMVAAATGLPETFFGDVSKGNHATAKSLDRPTELKFRDRQQLWQSIIQRICTVAVMRKARAPHGDKLQLVGMQMPAIQVTFPPILEHDVVADVAAVVSAATLNGQQTAGTLSLKTLQQRLASAVGIKLTSDDERVADERQQRIDSAPVPPAGNGGGFPPKEPKDPQTAEEALGELAATLDRVSELLRTAA